MRKHAGRCLLVGLLLAPTGAQVPMRVGQINDYAHVLDAGDVLLLGRLAADVLRERRVEVVVALMLDVPEDDAQAMATRLLDGWGVGGPPEEVRAGAVLVISVGDGGLGIAVNDIAAPHFGQAQLDALLDARVIRLLSERRYGEGLRPIIEGLGRMLEP